MKGCCVFVKKNVSLCVCMGGGGDMHTVSLVIVQKCVRYLVTVGKEACHEVRGSRQ